MLVARGIRLKRQQLARRRPWKEGRWLDFGAIAEVDVVVLGKRRTHARHHDRQSLSWSWACVNSLVGRPSLLNQRFDGFSISTRIGVTRLVDLVTHMKSG
jgi:hypothetical protein